jgi:hypothetical protein
MLPAPQNRTEERRIGIGRLSVSFSKKGFTGIRIVSFASLAGFGAWLFSNFLQLRGVVDLLASRIDLVVLGACLFGMVWILTITMSRKRTLRILAALVVPTVMVGLDMWAPKPGAIRVSVAYDVWQKLDVRPTLPNKTDPYKTLFSVSNGSDDYVIHKHTITCYANAIVTFGGGGMRNIGESTKEIKADLLPGRDSHSDACLMVFPMCLDVTVSVDFYAEPHPARKQNKPFRFVAIFDPEKGFFWFKEPVTYEKPYCE